MMLLERTPEQLRFLSRFREGPANAPGPVESSKALRDAKRLTRALDAAWMKFLLRALLRNSHTCTGICAQVCMYACK